MDFIISQQAYKRKNRYGMTEIGQYIYATLRATGWSVSDAWNIAFMNKGANWTKAALKEEQSKLEGLQSVQKCIKDLSGGSEKEELTPEELAEATSKEQILADLVLARKKMKSGSKEWQDTTKMIADYTRIKQDDLQVEDTTVHKYLPINYPTSCADCLLFKNGKADIGKVNKKE